MKIYWFRGSAWDNSTGNFGDWLTPYFLHKLTKVEIEWARPRDAEMFGCGSLIETVPQGFKGILLTTGMMHERTERRDLQEAGILALRGPFTAERIFEDPYPDDDENTQLGDLGLLCSLFAPKEKKRYTLGVIPHYVHQDREYDGHVIPICGGIEHVLREAAKCERIISSSLHGIILADALGIENQWEFSDEVFGKGFKFRDYAAALGETIEPGVWRLGNQERVGEIAERLTEILQAL